jgi:hypothetical protein
MKRFFSACFALTFLSSAFAACTLDFDQFNAAGGAGGSGGAGGTGGGCDCPDPGDPCVDATCTDGVCGTEPIPDGTEAGMQTAGDCKKLVCMGGMATSENDDMDPLDDGNACTVDACDGGMPTSNPAAPATPCTVSGGGSGVCNGMSACVGCLVDGDCPAGSPNCDQATNTCVNAQCTDMEKNGDETDVDCGGSCPPCPTGNDCNEDKDCQSGVCEGPQPNNQSCQAPACNDNVKNGQETDVDCGGNCQNDCGPNQGCNEDNDCEGNQCSGMGGTCVPNCDDEVQNGNETDVDCGGGGACDPCDVGDKCAANADCASNNCMGGTCELGVLGAACNVDGDCGSGQCADGVCCNVNCGNTCESCSLPGSEGTCTDVPSGNDPDNECMDPAVCDGTGACKKPDAEMCTNGGECLTGFCADGVCCNALCDGLCKSCNVAGSLGTCGNTPMGMEQGNECTGAQTCNGMGMCM